MKYKIMFMALLAMCACAFLVSQADESNAETITGSCGTDLTYSYDTETTVLTISGEGTRLVAPSYSQTSTTPAWGSRIGPYATTVEWDTPNITSIANGAFARSTGFKRIDIPETVTDIGNYLFIGDTNLESVSMEGDITLSTTTGLFVNCTNLKEVNIPNLKGIWNTLFSGCTALEHIDIPEGVTTLRGWNDDQGCFYKCSALSTISFPTTLTTIEDRSLVGCTSLSKITINSINLDYEHQITDIPALAEIIIGEDVKNISRNLFNNQSIHPTLYYYAVDATTNIFDALSIMINTLIIGENVNTIPGGSTAFSTALTYLKHIVYNAKNLNSSYPTYTPWGQLSQLQDITIGENVQSVPTKLFNTSNPRTNSLTVNWNATNCSDFATGNQIFYNSNVNTIIFGDNVQHIPAYLCEDMKSTLESVSFNDGLESIGAHAFDGCTNLAMVGLPDSVTEIGQQAFYGCTGILMPNLPSGIVNIHTGAFSGCPGVSISYLPATIEMIGKEAFRGCTAITKMVIPYGFDGTIGVNAFTDCTELSKILNLSELDIQLGSEDNGHIAYYADEVRDNIGSTAIVQQKQNVVHEVIEKSDAASKLLRVLPALMAIAVISFLCGLFYYRETERNKI